MSVLPDRFLNKKHPHSAANATSYVSRQVPLNVDRNIWLCTRFNNTY